MNLRTPLLTLLIIILFAPLTLAQTTTAPDTLTTSVNAAIDSALNDKRIVGAVVLVAHDGHLAYHRAAGLFDREANRPMKETAIFRLASMTKTIVSAAAMAMVEQDKIKLDDPVTKYLPDFRPKLANGTQPVITIHHLLTHTAGLGYGFYETPDGPYHKAGISDGLAEPGRTAEDNLKRLASVPLYFEPGKEWRYSLSIDVLGEVLAKAEGKSLHTVIKKYVTGPLEMTDTAFTVVARDRLAVPYANTPDGPVRMTNNQFVPLGNGTGLLFDPDRLFNKDSFPSGGAGLNGTAQDYLTFLEALRKGGDDILKPVTVKQMLSNQTGTLPNIGGEPGWQFCYGVSIKVDKTAPSPYALGTYSWGGAYGHSWFVDPENKLSVVILTNCTVEGMAGKLPSDIRDAIYKSLD